MTTEQERYAAAYDERTRLREQAWEQHKNYLEVEERRYQAELKHINDVYALRTGDLS